MRKRERSWKEEKFIAFFWLAKCGERCAAAELVFQMVSMYKASIAFIRLCFSPFGYTEDGTLPTLPTGCVRPIIPNGDINSTVQKFFQTGQSVSFTCSLGYMLNGTAVQTCNGISWTGQQPTCDCKKACVVVTSPSDLIQCREERSHTLSHARACCIGIST